MDRDVRLEIINITTEILPQRTLSCASCVRKPTVGYLPFSPIAFRFQKHVCCLMDFLAHNK